MLIKSKNQSSRDYRTAPQGAVFFRLLFSIIFSRNVIVRKFGIVF